METLAIAVVTISAGIWVGTVVFQSAIVAPTVFVDLDEATARSFLRTLFPRFFRLGLVCGALMLAGLIAIGLIAGWTTTVVSLAAMTGVMFSLEWISLAMVPYINAARDAGAAAHSRFARLHRTNVLLTVLILLLGIALLAIVAGHAAQGV